MKNILVDFYAPDDKRKQLEAIPDINVTYVEPEEKVRALADDLIRDTNILFATFPPENNLVMQQLELIQIASAGYTQLFGQNYVERNVRACNAAGVFDVPIGE
jgi:phosphoglycerate dehydrogenase-like enzyme